MANGTKRISRRLVIPDLPDEAEPSNMAPETARLIRLYLERVAAKLERVQASATYMNAFRRAAKMVRESKPD